MDEHDWLALRFEEHRGHLRAVAYRMLGSTAEADDAVQDAWLRVSRSGASGVENLGGWLTTIVARVCLNALHSRNARREDTLDDNLPERMASQEDGTDPEHEALIADSIGPALVVLDALTPSERVAFVLHDVFAVPFDDIAPIVGRSPTLPGNSRPAPGGGCEEQSRRQMRTCPPSGRSWTRSWPPRAAVTSPRSSRCSTRTS